MEKEQSDKIFNTLMELPENRQCVDCGCENPSWASVSNGVFLCINCCGVHRGFGVNISFIRSITMDSWTDSYINQINYGGNKRFKDFIQEYGLENLDPKQLYFTKALDFYRKKLKAISKQEEFSDEAPTKESGKEPLDQYQNTLGKPQEESKSAMVASSDRPFEAGQDGENSQEGVFLEDSQKKNSVMDKISFGLKKAQTSVVSGAHTAKQKIEEAKIGDKMKETGSKIGVGAKTFGSYVAVKSKAAASSVSEKTSQIKQNEKVQKFGQNVTTGFGKAQTSVKSGLTSIWGKLKGKKADNIEYAEAEPEQINVEAVNDNGQGTSNRI